MKIIGFPYANGSKIPGCELGFSCVFENGLHNININQSDVVVFKDYIKYESLYKRLVHHYIDNKQRFILFGSNHATTSYFVNNYLDKKLDTMFIFDAHNDYDINGEEGRFNWNVMNFIEEDATAINLIGYRHYDKNMSGNKVNTIYDLDFDNLPDTYKKLVFSKKQGWNYISIDLDVLNPSEFKGVNFPVFGGISLRELINCVLFILTKSEYCIIDIVEFNPLIEEITSKAIIQRLINEIIRWENNHVI